MNFSETMRASILRAILDRPEGLPESLVNAAAVFAQAETDAADADEDKARADAAWANAYKEHKQAVKVARNRAADRTDAAKKFSKEITKHADALPALLGEK